MPVGSVDTKMAEDPRSMADVVSLVEKFAREERLFVVFDEFQEVKRLEDRDQVLAILRGKIQFLSDTCFVFSGSVRDDMVDIFTNPNSPFFKSALTLNVAALPDEDFAPFLIERFAAGKRKADRAFIDAVFNLTNRTTGDVQQVCSAVWNTTERGARLSEADIRPALQEIFAQEGSQFEAQTSRLTRHQFKMLVALAKLGGTRIYSADFMATAEMPSSAAAAKALKRLVADGLVYLFGDEYRFFNPFVQCACSYSIEFGKVTVEYDLNAANREDSRTDGIGGNRFGDCQIIHCPSPSNSGRMWSRRIRPQSGSRGGILPVGGRGGVVHFNGRDARSPSRVPATGETPVVPVACCNRVDSDAQVSETIVMPVHIVSNK